MAQNQPSPDEKAVTALGDFTKWFTGLATAGLAFSIGLQNNIASYSQGARAELTDAWAAYAIAIIAGVLVQSSFPKMIQRSWTIDNPFVRTTYLVSFAGLAAGSIFTFFALRSAFGNQVSPDQLAVRTAKQAVGRVTGLIYRNERLASIDKVETLSGADAKAVGDQTWHVQFTVVRTTPKVHHVQRDLYVSATSGRATAYEMTKP